MAGKDPITDRSILSQTSHR
uniref:Uncharacterized protein n=1 Tax=Rhizophora mucronata TaxID=61149 RepID=A0A2P2QB44_RHIMU